MESVFIIYTAPFPTRWYVCWENGKLRFTLTDISYENPKTNYVDNNPISLGSISLLLNKKQLKYITLTCNGIFCLCNVATSSPHNDSEYCCTLIYMFLINTVAFHVFYTHKSDYKEVWGTTSCQIHAVKVKEKEEFHFLWKRSGVEAEHVGGH